MKRLVSLALALLCVSAVSGCGVSEDSFNKVSEELASLREEHSNAVAERDIAVEDNEELKEELEKAQMSLEETREELATAQSNLATAQTEAETARTERDAVKQEYDAYVAVASQPSAAFVLAKEALEALGNNVDCYEIVSDSCKILYITVDLGAGDQGDSTDYTTMGDTLAVLSLEPEFDFDYAEIEIVSVLGPVSSMLLNYSTGATTQRDWLA